MRIACNCDTCRLWRKQNAMGKVLLVLSAMSSIIGLAFFFMVLYAMMFTACVAGGNGIDVCGF